MNRLHYEDKLFAAPIVENQREISTLSVMLALREADVEKLNTVGPIRIGRTFREQREGVEASGRTSLQQSSDRSTT